MRKDLTRPEAVFPAVDINHSETRRKFLLQCGRYASITPPIVTLLLTATQARYATAASGTGPRPSASAQPSAGGFSLQNDGICSQAQSGPFVGDSPGCAQLRSRIALPR
jgi:hypothetical protein